LKLLFGNVFQEKLHNVRFVVIYTHSTTKGAQFVPTGMRLICYNIHISWYLESSLNKWSQGTLYWIGVFSDEIRCVCTSNLSDAMLYFMTKNKNVRNKFPTKISYWHVFTFIFLNPINYYFNKLQLSGSNKNLKILPDYGYVLLPNSELNRSVTHTIRKDFWFYRFWRYVTFINFIYLFHNEYL
jgi:hypothetical protein